MKCPRSFTEFFETNDKLNPHVDFDNLPIIMTQKDNFYYTDPDPRNVLKDGTAPKIYINQPPYTLTNGGHTQFCSIPDVWKNRMWPLNTCKIGNFMPLSKKYNEYNLAGFKLNACVSVTDEEIKQKVCDIGNQVVWDPILEELTCE